MANTTCKSSKRKLEVDFNGDNNEAYQSKVLVTEKGTPINRTHDLSSQILPLIEVINSYQFMFKSVSEYTTVIKAFNALSQFAKKEEMVDNIVECGAIPALVRVLDMSSGDDSDYHCGEYEVVKSSAMILGLISGKSEYQEVIVDAGALPYLVRLLRRHESKRNSPVLIGVLRKAADAITNLAHENTNVKARVRVEGGIPPLVELLEFTNTSVQKAAAGALRTLAFKNDENKNLIVGCNALPTLVLMLRSEDSALQYEAIGVIGNLVHSSPDIKKEVLQAGALQPVIGLLRSSCRETLREAALLIGQFASTDTDCKVHIAQRGAIQPLVDMLRSPVAHLREMSAFALGRLAQDFHNQAGIVYHGGIEPLVNLLGSKNGQVQHNAAFTLYGLAENEENVADIIKAGGFQKLHDGNFKVQQTKECVARTLTRLQEKVNQRVLKHLIYLMHFAEKAVKKRVALALAHLSSVDDCKTIFIDNNGLELLLDMLLSTNLKQTRIASLALHKLATRVISVSLVDVVPQSPSSQVYLGQQYVNNPERSDVTFLIEGKKFYAHRVCLISSEIFRAMFDGGYREREARDIEIPNIKWNIFGSMMRYIYTGTVHVSSDIAEDLLKAADQYLLEGLKRLCEYTISQGITVENVPEMYKMSDDYNATSLRRAIVIFVLDQFDKLSTQAWYCYLIRCIAADVEKLFSTLLTKPSSVADSPDS